MLGDVSDTSKLMDITACRVREVSVGHSEGSTEKGR